jgi:hypothetical protein
VSTEARDDAPLLRIVHGGEPTAEEVAALVAAVSAVSAGQPAAPVAAGRRRGGWSDRSSGLRRSLRAGVGAWRAYR